MSSNAFTNLFITCLLITYKNKYYSRCEAYRRNRAKIFTIMVDISTKMLNKNKIKPCNISLFSPKGIILITYSFFFLHSHEMTAFKKEKPPSLLYSTKIIEHSSR